jgi:hypothetical protein
LGERSKNEKSKGIDIVDTSITIFAWGFEDITIHIYMIDVILNLGFYGLCF